MVWLPANAARADVVLRRYGIACEPLPLRGSEIHAAAAIRYCTEVSGFAETMNNKVLRVLSMLRHSRSTMSFKSLNG